MSASSEEFREQLVMLLPPGEALSHEPDSTLVEILWALAEELARVDDRVGQFVDRELDMSLMTELLAEWEEMAGLPDGCGPLPTLDDERRNLVIQRLTDEHLMTAQALVDEALRLGYVITVREFDPTVCGDECGSVLASATIWFYFEVVYAGTTEFDAELGVTVVGDPLGDSIGPGRLVCLVDRMKPAHTLYTIVSS